MRGQPEISVVRRKDWSAVLEVVTRKGAKSHDENPMAIICTADHLSLYLLSLTMALLVSFSLLSSDRIEET